MLIPYIKNTEKVSDKISQFLDVVDGIPMGNSKFQNQKIVVDGMRTPERAYRHAALRIQNRLSALSECETTLKKKDIEIKRNKRKIERLNVSKVEDYDLDIEELEVEIEIIEWNRHITKKMVKDCIYEINDLLPIINAVWNLSREAFEAWEAEHFKQVHTDSLQWKNDSYLLLETIEQKEQDLYSKILKWEHTLHIN